MFWETKKEYLGIHAPFIPVEDIVADTVRYLRDYISYIPFEIPILLFLNIKLKTPREICMNEILAIYVVMSFLGSLVRYRPEVLEHMLEKRDAWIIENFIRSVPTNFLAHARNFLDGQYLAYRLR